MPDYINDRGARIQYIASAAQTEFEYPFELMQTGDLDVYVDGVLQSYETHYTIVEADPEDEDDDLDGGAVTFEEAMAGGEIVTLVRNTAIARNTGFTQNGPHTSAAFNTEFDRLYIIAQELNERFSRSLHLPALVTGTDFEIDPETFAGHYLSFNADGEPEPADLTATTISQSVMAPLLFPRTVAEISAGVTPTNYIYQEGDIRRYGAISDGSTDCALAWQNACAVAAASTSPRSTRVYIPPAQQGWYVSAGATVSLHPIAIYGENSYYSYLWTDQNITILTIENVQQNAGPVLKNFQFIRSAGGNKAGLHIKNSSYGVMENVHVQGFYYGVHFDDTITAPSSCYSWTMTACVIIGNVNINIYAGRATNFLTMINCTWGACPTGLWFYESQGLQIFGGDAEGCTSCCVDIDSSVEVVTGITIQGADFEGSVSTLGTIRIGATATIHGVNIKNNLFVNAGEAEYSVNIIRGIRTTLEGNAVDTGTDSGYHVTPVAASIVQTGTVEINNGWQATVGAISTTGALWPIKDQSAGNYTLVAEDNGKNVRMANTYTLTIPPNSAVPFPIGAQVKVHQWSASGAATVARGVGVTLYKTGTNFTDADATLTNFAQVTLTKMATNTWAIEGFGWT
jgi:hypothetical protein